MLTEITLGQYFPGNSLIHRLDPRTKILATIIYIIAIFFADTSLSYGILTAFAAGVIMISRLPWLMVLKSLKPIWIIIFFTLLIHMFTAPGEHIIWTWKFLSVTQEGLDLGLKMAVRLVLLLLFSSVLTFTTSPIVLTDGIEHLLRPFKALGVPAHELAMAQNGYPVAELFGHLQHVGGEEDRPALRTEGFHLGLELMGGHRVQPDKGLVH